MASSKASSSRIGMGIVSWLQIVRWAEDGGRVARSMGVDGPIRRSLRRIVGCRKQNPALGRKFRLASLRRQTQAGPRRRPLAGTLLIGALVVGSRQLG